jgi:hypothetical protein
VEYKESELGKIRSAKNKKMLRKIYGYRTVEPK